MEWSGPPTLVQSVRAEAGAGAAEVSCLDARGARLVSGEGRGALRLWRWAAGTGWAPAAEVRRAHRYGVTAARWAPAGALLASAGVDGAARLWSGALGARGTLAAPGAAAARALAWAGAGRLLAGHDDGAVCVWHVPRAVLLARLPAHEGSVHALAVAARGALLFTACTNGVLKVYNLVELCRDNGGGGVEGEDGCVGAVALAWEDGAHDMGALCADGDGAADGALVATGGHDARVRLWRAARDQAPALWPWGALAGHAAAVTAVRWAAGALLASASLDRTARLWDARALACLHVVPAHTRYLTCLALADDLRYMVTGSNDKSVRMWALGALSLDDELEPACSPGAHFALGDLEGIGPVAKEPAPRGERDAEGSPERGEDLGEDGDCECVFSERAHAGAINCIAVHGELVATASSDGTVKVWRHEGADGSLSSVVALAAHLYPALVVDFLAGAGAGGPLLLTAGLDGCAFIWDVETGVQVRSLSVPGAGGCAGGAAGGGGVRAGRAAPRAPHLLLLGTDDGLAPLFDLASTDPDPIFVYGGHAEAVTCCAWSADGRAAATGAASGELRVLAPPRPAPLHHHPHAHDLGVLSCDFAPSSADLGLPEGSYLLATAGSDSLVKLWTVTVQEMRVVRAVAAHGAAVESVRWARAGAVLVTAGADRWARVWRVRAGAELRVRAAGAAPSRGAGGALAAAPLAADGALLALGTLAGELAVWKLRALPSTPLTAASAAVVDCALPLHWSHADVVRWIREYIVGPPGSNISEEVEEHLMLKVDESGATGVDLIHGPIEELLEKLGFEEESVSVRARAEVAWLRGSDESSQSSASPHPEREVPHRLLCPVTHRALREPVRAADGCTYERAAILEWLLAEGSVSPVSGTPLAAAALAPNYALRDQLQAFCRGRPHT